MARVPIRQDLLDLIFQSNSHLSNLFGHATWFVQLLFSIILIVSIVALIINITKLAMSGGNPQARSEAIRNILDVYKRQLCRFGATHSGTKSKSRPFRDGSLD